MRKHGFFGPIVAFILDDVDLKRPNYELFRFFASFIVLLCGVLGFLAFPRTGSLVIVVTGFSLLFFLGTMSRFLNFGLRHFSWVPLSAIHLSVIFGTLSIAWEPAETWGVLVSLVLFAISVFSYMTASVKLIALAIKRRRTN